MSSSKPLYPDDGDPDEDGGTPCDNLHLNLRGTQFTLATSWLRKHPNCRLSTLSEEDKEYNADKGEYFFNRNPTLFHYILDYLVDGGEAHFPTSICPQVIMRELEFWGLEEDVLGVCCWDRLQECRETMETLEQVKKEWQTISERYIDEYVPVSSKSQIEPLGDDNVQIVGDIDPTKLPLRDRMWLFMEDPDYSTASKVWSVIVLSFIGMSIIGMILESIPECRLYTDEVWNRYKAANQTRGNLFYFLIRSKSHTSLAVFEGISMGVFTTELVLRYVVCRNKRTFYNSFLNVIDLLAIIPAWILIILNYIVVEGFEIENDTLLTVVYITGCFRVLRTFRLFKLMKHYKTLKVIYLALVASYREFLLLVLLLVITATIYGHFIYFAEIYDDNFETIPYALWWAVITMTTVGYGDFYPKTFQGYVVGAFCAVAGILVIAMPVPIIVNNFSSYYSSAQVCTRLWQKAKDDSKKRRKKKQDLDTKQVPGKEDTFSVSHDDKKHKGENDKARKYSKDSNYAKNQICDSPKKENVSSTSLGELHSRSNGLDTTANSKYTKSRINKDKRDIGNNNVMDKDNQNMSDDSESKLKEVSKL